MDPTVERAVAATALGLGHRRWPAGTQAWLTELLGDADPRVRAAAIGALVRRGTARASRAAWLTGVSDADPSVRRRALELAPGSRVDQQVAVETAVEMLGDVDPLVAETAAFVLGEIAAPDGGAVGALQHTATSHSDALVREAAVGALGALGDPRGLPAILAACGDKPAIRRRAVLALAPFSGPEVDAAIERARSDRDWQVRQAAEDLEPMA